MFCKNCGVEQSEDAVFCHSCGEKLNQETSEQAHNEQKEPDLESADQESSEDHHLINLYVGEKIDYYRTKWKKKNFSWNWPAFFLTFLWLGYRKMYGTIFMIIGIYFFFDIIFLVFGFDVTGATNVGLVVSVVLGMSGNNLYREHSKRQVMKVKKERGEKAVEYLQANGGPSWGGVWLSAAIFIGYVLIAVFLISPTEEEAAQNAPGVEVSEEEEEEVVDEEKSNESTEEEVESEEATTSAGEGEELYQNTCSACHAQDLNGSVGPGLRDVGAAYSKEEIIDIMVNGMGSMPAGLADHLSDEELDKLAAWLLEQ